jgi:hypothetical protein
MRSSSRPAAGTRRIPFVEFCTGYRQSVPASELILRWRFLGFAVVNGSARL